MDHHLNLLGQDIKEPPRLMTSNPLFISVVESMEIFAPLTSWDGQGLAPG